MRAYYATQEHVRLFVLGVPEGWLVSAYDLQKHEWVLKDGHLQDSLKTAKAFAEEEVTSLVGKKAANIRWH
jgi:hypothetical protein